MLGAGSVADVGVEGFFCVAPGVADLGIQLLQVFVQHRGENETFACAESAADPVVDLNCQSRRPNPTRNAGIAKTQPKTTNRDKERVLIMLYSSF